MARLDVTRRIVRLMWLLHGHRYMPPQADVLRDLGVCRRTLARYLVALEQAGFELPKSRNEDRRNAA